MNIMNVKLKLEQGKATHTEIKISKVSFSRFIANKFKRNEKVLSEEVSVEGVLEDWKGIYGTDGR